MESGQPRCRSMHSTARIIAVPRAATADGPAPAGHTARTSGSEARQTNTPVAAIIIRSDAVAASTDTRHRLIQLTSGPANTIADTRAITNGGST